ncbi:hypothetical protein SPBR_08562 [Sporothrix brasiliensis 5110]|uniref:Uncharacterized protein n=1 Tax=Sporothrix brasiliensis 5110 TaxID=1398154 RepID=A0A0C2ELI7_9PEZI|nr:uncharacterized protein SPBR_08562 [Sporothrix brasiliensis 5110]KIH86979.1 hypothetical protein SPBR_08562 [Sporothrix brasiliensis 5110]
MGFGDLFRSSKGPKRPSSSRMPTDCVPSSSSASRPHTSASSKLGRRGAIKSDHSSSGHCAGRIQNTPVSPRGPHQPDPLLAGNEAYPVDLSSVSGGFGVPIAATRTVPVSHASSSHRPSHKHHSKRETQYEPERDAYEVSPLDAAFPPEVQRVLDRGFSSAASLGVSRNVPQVSTRGPSRNPSTAASSSSRSFAARAAEAQFAFDIGGYGPRTNHFVSPCYQPSYTSNSTGAYYNEGGLF